MEATLQASSGTVTSTPMAAARYPLEITPYALLSAAALQLVSQAWQNGFMQGLQECQLQTER